MLSSLISGSSPFRAPVLWRANPDVDNYRLESRMRETRTYGSEGGEEQSFPTPITLKRVPRNFFRTVVSSEAGMTESGLKAT
jgi:hypothetical protein